MSREICEHGELTGSPCKECYGDRFATPAYPGGSDVLMIVEMTKLLIRINALESALREIAEAKGFDNIGNWARSRAKQALENG